MSDIASSLEQEFADHSKANRESRIVELKQIESRGSGSVVIKAHAIMLPLILGFAGFMLKYTSFDFAQTIDHGTVVGAVLVAICAWALFGPRKPLLTLTEEGVRVKDVLLPWSSIEDYSPSIACCPMIWRTNCPGGAPVLPDRPRTCWPSSSAARSIRCSVQSDHVLSSVRGAAFLSGARSRLALTIETTNNEPFAQDDI